MAQDTVLLISDLHLSPELPALTAAFLHLLDTYRPRLQALYILGDWFESWVGDDDDDAYLKSIIKSLQNLTQHGVTIYALHGNRDFLLGNTFMATFGGKLLPERLLITLGTDRLQIEHGDALCIDDHQYQQFRAQSRQPVWQQNILSQPLDTRRQIAQMARMQSKMTQANQSSAITDINPDEACRHLAPEACGLLHGHTHRPGIYQLPDGRPRWVLGDWQDHVDHVSAVIGQWQPETGLTLLPWQATYSALGLATVA